MSVRAKLSILFALILSYISFGIATNYLSYNIDQLRGLGPLGGWYYPREIVIWTLQERIQGEILSTAWTIAASGSLIGFFILIFSLKKKSTNTTIHGSSRWMNASELKKSGMLTDGGIILAQSQSAKYRQKNDRYSLKKPGNILFDNSPEHALIVAPTRRGKGINNVVPTLLHWPGSCIVYDLKKENWDVTAGWRSKFSHVLRFEPTSETSVRFNPLEEIKKGNKEVPQVQNLCEILTNPFGESSKDHWNINANQLLVGIMLHILYAESDKSLYGMYKILNNPEEDTRQTLEKMLKTPHLGDRTHPAVEQAARNMLNKEDKELSSIVSTASSYLTLYQDPIIARNTSTSDFKINQMMDLDNPISLYLVVLPSDADRLKPLTRLILQLVANKLTSEGVIKRKHRLLYLIDEFPALGNISFFETQLAFFAGYGIKCVIIAQSFNQLYKIYTRNTSIPDNCRTKIALGADSPEEARIIAEYLGKETITQKSKSKSGRTGALGMAGQSVSESETGRELMSMDEILRLDFTDVLVLKGGKYPYKAKKIMYFADKRFQDRMNLDRPDSAKEQAKWLPDSISSDWSNLVVTQEINQTEEIQTENKEQPEPEPVVNKVEPAESTNKKGEEGYSGLVNLGA